MNHRTCSPLKLFPTAYLLNMLRRDAVLLQKIDESWLIHPVSKSDGGGVQVKIASSSIWVDLLCDAIDGLGRALGPREAVIDHTEEVTRGVVPAVRNTNYALRNLVATHDFEGRMSGEENE